MAKNKTEVFSMRMESGHREWLRELAHRKRTTCAAIMLSALESLVQAAMDETPEKKESLESLEKTENTTGDVLTPVNGVEGLYLRGAARRIRTPTPAKPTELLMITRQETSVPLAPVPTDAHMSIIEDSGFAVAINTVRAHAKGPLPTWRLGGAR